MAAPRDRGATQAVPRPQRQFCAQCAWTRRRQHLSAKRCRLALRRLMVSGNAMHQGVRKRASKTIACSPPSSERAAHLKKAATTCLLAACASPKMDGLRKKVTDDHPVPVHRGVVEHRLTAFHSSLCQSLLREGLRVCVHNNALLFKANLCRVRGRSIHTLSCRYGSHGAQCYKHHS